MHFLTDSRASGPGPWPSLSSASPLAIRLSEQQDPSSQEEGQKQDAKSVEGTQEDSKDKNGPPLCRKNDN